MTFGYFAAAYIFKGLLELTMPSRTALLIFVIAAVASIVIERIVALITNAILKVLCPIKSKTICESETMKKRRLTAPFICICYPKQCLYKGVELVLC